MFHQQNQGPQDPAFKALMHRPVIAWPTVIWFLFTLAIWLASTYAGLQGWLPVWVSVIINGIAVFAFFTVIHDSSHRAVFKNTFLNNVIGSISTLFYGPFTFFTLRAFRYIHMQHHLNTNDPQTDPDYWCAKGNAFTRCLRWATVDMYYVYYYMQRVRQRPISEIIGLSIHFILTSSLFLLLWHAGYGWQAVFYWLLPGRIGFVLLSYCLDYLPHAPHKALQADQPYQATSVRVGNEWLLSTLLMGHNYHLMHHLFPLAPFYRYRKMWIAGEAFFLEHQPFIVTPLSKPLTIEEYKIRKR